MPRTNLSYLKNVILAATGIPVGVLTGLTGISPAPLVQPILTWLLGLNGATLNGVVLAAVSFSAWSGLLSYGQFGDVSWLEGFVLLIGNFVGAVLAGKAILRSPIFFVRSRTAWSFLPLFFATTMIVCAVEPSSRSAVTFAVLPHSGPILPLVWSILIGIIAGFVGQAGEIGSILVVPLLLFFLGKTIWQSEGTALFVLVLASLPTVLIHALKGQINANAAIALSIGAVFGALYGSHSAVYQVADGTLVLITGITIAVFSLIKLFQRPRLEIDSATSSDSETSSS
jgi:uncharacterized protein